MRLILAAMTLVTAQLRILSRLWGRRKFPAPVQEKRVPHDAVVQAHYLCCLLLGRYSLADLSHQFADGLVPNCLKNVHCRVPPFSFWICLILASNSRCA
jgi:hypothetical protein